MSNHISTLGQARRIEDLVRELSQVKAENVELRRALSLQAGANQQSQNAKLREAVEALLSNEEHAASGGMRTYQIGSQTWEIWEAVRQAMQGDSQ